MFSGFILKLIPMTQIGVRTVQTPAKTSGEHFEVIEENPFRSVMLRVTGIWCRFSDFARTPGILCMATLWWGMYPRFARFRHNNIRRYRRKQVEYREGLFHTKNITKIRDPNEVRPGWKGWAGFFVLARGFQDATEMPEMQSFPT
ncbi:Hypothetical protein, putative [Bodo saltans]|uniref:Uncharacterized protein n=1 Tax=Bodo saltans TaxID=75058 RepID=A0A0S4JCG3_BODSA|nr:Hypothetical protein, putative [Bodo saltans]|eukprot:CUG87885.1 Hypothetical protein, putative [Bodo saltans]